ncbi:hypothetical protein [Chryseobacterium formosense]|nr:hypothetical protein [Chryseobacterium formosense]
MSHGTAAAGASIVFPEDNRDLTVEKNTMVDHQTVTIGYDTNV